MAARPDPRRPGIPEHRSDKLIDPRVHPHAPRVVVYVGTSKLETRLAETWAKRYAVGFQDLISCAAHFVPKHLLAEAS